MKTKNLTQQKPVMLRVKEKKIEAPGYATLFFEYNLPFSPGQFIMVWIPGLDEKPYTISHHSENSFAITVEAKGIFSNKLLTLEKGDLVGIRGPFGRGFDIYPEKKAAVVAGGCGMAPVATLLERLPTDTVVIHGARTRELILFPERFSFQQELCTDDGTFGEKGLVTDLLKRHIEAGKHFDMVYACGPEIMMYKVFELCEAHNIPCQVSLERYMRCGFGLCGACVCGKQLVCKDGPVFHSEILREIKDFNKKALLKSGQEVDIGAYFAWRSN
jgi:dihydroorotate dehydrogenase electron transfer subunit